MKRFSGYLIALLCLSCIATLFVYYLTTMPAHLKWQEQNQIFITSSDWLAAYFSKPAWLSCMAAEWLIQFFYIPAAAAAILSLSIACAAFGVYVPVSGIIGRRIASAIASASGIWLVFTTFNELSSLPFIISVAGGALLSVITAYLQVNSKRVVDFSPLLVVLSFWLFGVGAWLTAILVALRALKTHKRSGIAVAIISLAFAIVTPLALASRYSLAPFKAAIYPGLPAVSLPDKNRLQRLAVEDAYYRGDLEATKRLAMSVDNPNDITAFYYYLACARQDSLPDNLMKYPLKYLGTLTTIGETTPLPVINIMNDLYFTLGDMTYAERAAMMRNVFSPHNRNSSMVRRLAEINLVTGDTLAAKKYLRILRQVPSQSQWSRDHIPGKMTPLARNEIISCRQKLNQMPDLRIGDNCRYIILQLLESNHNNTVALDYLLCTDLLLKDIETFKNDYDTYCMAKDAPRYKDLYQQALMIYLAGTDAPQEEWQKYIVSQDQLQRFNAYSMRRGDRSFADTYWYYFDLQQ